MSLYRESTESASSSERSFKPREKNAFFTSRSTSLFFFLKSNEKLLIVQSVMLGVPTRPSDRSEGLAFSWILLSESVAIGVAFLNTRNPFPCAI